MKNAIKQVAITGGTHGNELTGVYLIKHWSSCPEEVQRDSFATELHLTNPSANQQVRRYIDQDLNRQFNIQDLNNPELDGCEQQRAKALNTLLGPKEDPRVDFVIDLHTTTANMGMSLVFNTSDPFVVGMAFYIKQKMPHATLFFHPSDRLEDNFLTSVGRFNGFLIEAGPVAQGLLNYQVYSETRTAVMHALDYLEKVNAGGTLDLPRQMSGYQFIEKIRLPEDSTGEITAMVHPNLQDKDYHPINPGDPLFITLAGETIPYQGDTTVYGAFINEAAYYDQHIGLSFMREVDITLNDVN
ncbi:aspartoacylase [Microbulbifer agarilyticus]|uniref:Aspartoacylase n=1 Tax=Microbulbifer agarilyticus TaxID=260552 RepID=A0A1Q2M481_9GAMM|nr:aspartoacylase [Microbulbifer agarilyticus]AQQ67057.1 aspartoacylase [Microbulbifer agarilyticus]